MESDENGDSSLDGDREYISLKEEKESSSSTDNEIETVFPSIVSAHSSHKYTKKLH